MAVTREVNGGIGPPLLLDWGYYFVAHVQPSRKGARKVLLIHERYCAHLSLVFLDLFHENDIIVYVLSSHSSGKTQPRDVFLFLVFQNCLRDAVCCCAARGTVNQYYFLFSVLFSGMRTIELYSTQYLIFLSSLMDLAF